MGRVRWVLVAPLIMVIAVVAGFPQTASAGCHAFTVEVSPARVTEGGNVTVSVRRDAGVAPSQVDVETVAETAQAGVDFAELHQTVSFGVGPTQQILSVSTTDDDSPEASETFRLHLSNPAGCAVNPNLTVGPDATVTIDDNDVAPTEPPPTEPPPTEPPETIASTTTSPTTTTAASLPSPIPTSTAPTTSATAPGEAAPGPVGGSSDGDSGGSRAAVALLAAATAAVVGAIAYLVWRRQGQRSSGT